MSRQYNGIASNVSYASPVTIATSNNILGVPVVFTTVGDHGLSDGDLVHVAGHSGGVSGINNANWQAHVLSLTTFSIPVLGLGGSGGTGGTVQSLALLPTFAIPSDGDTFDAAAFDVAYEALGDRTQYLAAQIDTNYYFAGNYPLVVSDPSDTLGTIDGWTTTSYVAGTHTLSISGCQKGDYIVVSGTYNVHLADTSNTLPPEGWLQWRQSQGGGSDTAIAGSKAYWRGGTPPISGFSINPSWAASVNLYVNITTPGTCVITPYGKVANTNFELTTMGEMMINASVFRKFLV